MISLNNIAKNLLESYNDDFGFVNDEYDDKTPIYDVLVTYGDYGIELALVRKKGTKETYIIDIDEVPHEYYQGYYHWVNEDDPDFEDDNSWEDAYREFDDDTQLFDDGVAFYAEDSINDEDVVTTDVNEMLDRDRANKYVLKITPENKADVYREFHGLIEAYLEPSYEERKKDKKDS
jgi:hypothetical protein